jgi:hypothetical protein
LLAGPLGLPDGSESDEKLAIRVDSVRHPSTEDEVRDSKTQGWRFYLRSDDARKHPKALLDELEKELDTRSQGGHASDKPMPWALRDVGYTHNGPSRLKAQEKLSSAANRIMGLFSAIAESHPDFIARQKKQLEDDQTVQPVKYQAHGEVIFLCFRHTHAALAECMFSVLARSYSKWGRGFNTVEAGQSIASNKQYDLLEFWEDWQADVYYHSPFQSNAEADKKRIEELEAAEREMNFLKYNKVSREIELYREVREAVNDLMRAFGRLITGEMPIMKWSLHQINFCVSFPNLVPHKEPARSLGLD